MDTRDYLESGKVVAIIRGDYREVYPQMVESLIAGGIKSIEITLNSPGAVDAIRLIAKEFADRIRVGAGTVMTPAEVDAVAAAGAKYVISPSFLPTVVKATLGHGLEPIPGTFTPTEIANAAEAGARLIKWFPALGPDYLKALRGPFNTLHFMPTGTVDESNIRAYFDAGAAAVGLGKTLVPEFFDGSPEACTDVTVRARRILDRVYGRAVASYV
jgi:2-dehydro-3-deoxyphosphogluconate aldolase/(4S)-4-hydroxy-2-oxoglutarate aldolase